MSAAESAQAISERKIIDNARPKGIGHSKGFQWLTTELLQFQQCHRREYQGPQLLQVALTELECLHHRPGIRRCAGVFPGEWGFRANRCCGMRYPNALPNARV